MNKNNIQYLGQQERYDRPSYNFREFILRYIITTISLIERKLVKHERSSNKSQNNGAFEKDLGTDKKLFSSDLGSKALPKWHFLLFVGNLLELNLFLNNTILSFFKQVCSASINS